MPPIDPLNSVPRTAPRVGVAGYDRRAGPSAWASLLCQGLSNPRPCLIPVLAPGVPRRVRPLLCPHRVLIGIVDAEDMPNRQGASAQRAADGPAGRCAVRRATASRRLGGSPTCRTPWTSTWPLGGPPPISRTSCRRLGAASSTHRRSADGRGRTPHPRTRAPRSSVVRDARAMRSKSHPWPVWSPARAPFTELRRALEDAEAHLNAEVPSEDAGWQRLKHSVGSDDPPAEVLASGNPRRSPGRPVGRGAPDSPTPGPRGRRRPDAPARLAQAHCALAGLLPA